MHGRQHAPCDAAQHEPPRSVSKCRQMSISNRQHTTRPPADPPVSKDMHHCRLKQILAHDSGKQAQHKNEQRRMAQSRRSVESKSGIPSVDASWLPKQADGQGKQTKARLVRRGLDVLYHRVGEARPLTARFFKPTLISAAMQPMEETNVQTPR